MSTCLKYFVEVVRQGSLRGASKKLKIAASAISRQIKMLESEFDVSFLQRSVKGIELTAAGEAFLVYANCVEAERNRLRQSIDDLNKLQRGHVRIASIDGIVAGPLSHTIAAFRVKYEGVTFEMKSIQTKAAMESARKSNAEIGIAFHSISIEGVWVADRVRDPLHAIVGINYHLSKRQSISLKELVEYPIALLHPSVSIRKLVDGVRMNRNLHLNTTLLPSNPPQESRAI